jgi:hypothetical protein
MAFKIHPALIVSFGGQGEKSMKKLFLLGVGILGMNILLADITITLKNGYDKVFSKDMDVYFIFRYKDKAVEDHYTVHGGGASITKTFTDTDFHYIGAWCNDSGHLSGSLTASQIDQIKKYPKRTWTIEAEPDNHYEKLIMNLSFQT